MMTTRYASLLIITISLLFAFQASGSDRDPEGFLELAWGSAPKKFIKSKKELRKNYSVKSLNATLNAGQIAVVTTRVEYLGMKGDCNYLFTKEHGFYGVEFSFEDNRPEAALEQDGKVQKLKKIFGEPEMTRDMKYLWKGENSVIQAHFPPFMSGYKLELKIWSKAGYNDVVLEK